MRVSVCVACHEARLWPRGWFEMKGDEARRFPQGGIFLGRPTLRCGRELGILNTAELTWLEKGSVSLWAIFDCECRLNLDRDREGWYHSDWTDKS